MRSLLLVAFNLALLLAIGSGSVLAAGPEHIQTTGTGTDADFCDTGESVTFSFRGAINEFESKVTGQEEVTFTNPLTGASVIVSVSGQLKFERVEDGGGAYTWVETRTGSPNRIRLPNGELLTQDVGSIIGYHHFDADDNYLGSEFVVRGPHPEFESDFTLFCEVVIPALGL